METRACQGCGEPINLLRGHARTCSSKCRVRVHRMRRKAAETHTRIYKERRWVRADGKRPLQLSGKFASVAEPKKWHTFQDVQDGPGDGYGVMLGDGLGCYDLDDVTDAQARSFISQIPDRVLFCERSLSGGGVHVFVAADEGIGWRKTIDGMSVERYTRARFIRMTGVEFVAR